MERKDKKDKRISTCKRCYRVDTKCGSQDYPGSHPKVLKGTQREFM